MATRRRTPPSDKPGSGPTSRERQIVAQLDALEEASNAAREQVLGTGWIEQVENFYNMVPAVEAAPSFRPRINVPELQQAMLSEAADLSDTSPRIYIVKKDKDERDRDREQALQAQWTHGNFNLEIMKGIIWALFSGNAYFQVGFDPGANEGEGEVWLEARDPSTVAPDPFARTDKRLAYVILRDAMYIDEMQRRWPDQGYRVRKSRPGAPQVGLSRLSLPPGPMSSVGGMPAPGGVPLPTGGQSALDDSRIIVRTAHIDDYSYEEVLGAKKYNKESGDLLAKPSYKPMYPHGRLIVECEGIVLFDGPNPLAGGVKPLASLWCVPPLNSYFAPPAIKFTKDLQGLAERMYTQVYENAVRLNNGITFIDENAEIDIEEYGGIPGEVHEIATGARIPETKWPNAMPAHMIELPKLLLEMQRGLQSRTDSRMGKAPSGNVSAPLFDATVLQGQSITRLRSRFLAVTIQRIAELVFGMMGKFYTAKRTFPVFAGENYSPVNWEPLDEYDPVDYSIMVDSESIKPYSATTMRMMIPLLKQFGMIDTESGLELLEVSDRQKIMERLGKENQAKAAQAAAQKGGGKKK